MKPEEQVAEGGAVAQTRLQAAVATERSLREQVNDLVRARARADSERLRLEERAKLRGAEPMLATVAERYARQSERLGTEIESLRSSLREQEAATEAARADEAGA